MKSNGLACKRAAPAGDHLRFADVEEGYTLLALVGIIDPPREEAIRAVGECHRAGIPVKMITGDHAETARAIGAQLAIGIGKGLTGNRYVLAAIAACIPLQLAFTHAPAMQAIFGSADLSVLEWLKVIGAGLLMFCIAELEKLVMRRARLAAAEGPA